MGKTTSNRKCGIFVGLTLIFCACGEPTSDSGSGLTAELQRQHSRWVPLGNDFQLEDTSAISRLDLAGEPLMTPVLAYSLDQAAPDVERTWITRFIAGAWQWLGQPLLEHGPAVGADSERRIFVCTGGDGPFVRRWNGTTWAAVGGDIGEETGYKGSRYQVYSCGGIVLDRADNPIVTWSADVGAKANLVYAARYDRGLNKWQGLGVTSIGGRATEASIGIDTKDRVYVASYSPGGSYGGGATTRVWRYEDGIWSQLGGDMPNTSEPTLAVFDKTAYLALRDNASGNINVMEWCLHLWHQLPSPGSGNSPTLAFSRTGNPVMLYSVGAVPADLRVQILLLGNWTPVGSPLPDEKKRTLGPFDLSVSAGGRPTAAWVEIDESGHSRIAARRFSSELP